MSYKIKYDRQNTAKILENSRVPTDWKDGLERMHSGDNIALFGVKFHFPLNSAKFRKNFEMKFS